MPAWAQVCNGWDGIAVTPMAEAIALFSTLPALILIFCSLLALRLRHMWGGLFVVLAWSTLLTVLISYDPDGARQSAINEGCRGDPALFIGTVIAICGVILIFTGPKRAPASDGES